MTDVSTSGSPYLTVYNSVDQLTQAINSVTSGRQPPPSTIDQDFLTQLEAAGIKPVTTPRTDPATMQTNDLNNTIQNSVLPQYLLMPSNVIV